MDITPAPGHRPRRGSRRNDPVLYPVLRYREREPETPGRWQRLREYLADCLTAPYEGDDWRLSRDLGVRVYQAELARRSRSTLRQRTRDGWWLGPAPYGYALDHHRVEPESGRADGRHRLRVDEARARVVPLIFTWYRHERLSERGIARRLNEQQHPQPADPVTGRTRAWSPSFVHTVLNNPVYLGYAVRGRTLRGADRPPECWTWSQQQCHRALVEPGVFWAVYNSRFQWAPPHIDPIALDDDSREAA